MRWSSEAITSKVHPENNYSKTSVSKVSKLETSDHSAALRGPHLVITYKLNGHSGYR